MEQPLDDGGRRHVRLEEERGAAKVSNVADARRGRITNVILFTDPESKAEALRVRLTARAAGARTPGNAPCATASTRTALRERGGAPLPRLPEVGVEDAADGHKGVARAAAGADAWKRGVRDRVDDDLNLVSQ